MWKGYGVYKSDLQQAMVVEVLTNEPHYDELGSWIFDINADVGK